MYFAKLVWKINEHHPRGKKPIGLQIPFSVTREGASIQSCKPDSPDKALKGG
jgi:hypothetical protein